jgi:hypothetical protein
VQRAASVISISVTAAVCSGIAAMFMLIHSARVAGRESDSDPERARQVRAHEVVVAKVRGVPVLALVFPAAPSLLPIPVCRARLSMYPHVTCLVPPTVSRELRPHQHTPPSVTRRGHPPCSGLYLSGPLSRLSVHPKRSGRLGHVSWRPSLSSVGSRRSLQPFL